MAPTLLAPLRDTRASSLDHVMIHVKDLQKSKAFYLQALAPLGYETIVSIDEAAMVGLGAKGKPDLFLEGSGSGTLSNVHLAWRVHSPKMVQAFHEAAVAAGGKDNGKPGPRDYHEGYYGAFVIDPDGNNIECVCHNYRGGAAAPRIDVKTAVGLGWLGLVSVIAIAVRIAKHR